MPKNFPNISIRSKLLFISGGLVVLIVSALICLITTYASQSLKVQMQHNLDITLMGESKSLNERITKLQEDSESWSQEPIVTIFLEKPNLLGLYRPGLDSLFRHRLKNTPWISNVLLIDDSKVRYQYSNNAQQQVLPEESELIALIQDAPDIFSVSQNEQESMRSYPLLFLKTEYNAQFTERDNTLLVTVVDLTRFHDAFYSRSRFSGSDFFTFVAMSEQKEILLPAIDASEPMMRQFQQLISTWDSHATHSLISESIITINLKIPEMPLYLFVVSSVSKINEPIDNLVQAMLFVGSVTLFIGLSAAYLFSRRVTEPILNLTEAMQKYSTDSLQPITGLDHLQPVLKRNDELGILATTFREMGSRIEQEIEDRLKLEHYFQNITDQTFDAITVIDDEGNILTWNRACEKIFGYTYDEVIGKSFHNILITEELFTKTTQDFPEHIRNSVGPLIGKIFEVEAVHKDGHKIPVEVSVNVISNHGRWNAFGIIRDLTEKKRLENEKRNQEIAYIEQSQREMIQKEFITDITRQKEEFESIFLHLNFGIAILDQDSHFIDFNGAFLNMLGYEHSDLIQKTWQDLTPAVEFPKVQSSFEKVFTEDSIEELEQMCVTHDGSNVYINMAIALLPDKKRLLISAKDHTEKHYFEKKLQDSESTFRGFMDSIGQMIAVMDENGTFIDYFKGVNTSIYGYEKEEVIGKNLTMFTSECQENTQRIYSKIKQVYSGKENLHFETMIREKDGLTRPFEIFLSKGRYFGQSVVLAVLIDMTEQKKLEHKIEAEKNNYQTLMDQSSEAIFIMNISDGTLVQHNKMVEKCLQYNEDELKNLTVFDWDKEIKTEEEYREIIKNVTYEPIVIERIHTRKDGSTYVASINIVKVSIDNNEYIYASVRDITEQKNIEKQLQDRIKQQDALLNIETTGLMRAQDRKFIWVNNAFERMFGYTKEELIGVDTRIMYADDKAYADFGKGYPELQEKGIFTSELRCAHKNGKRITILGCMTAIDSDSSEIIGVLTDITPLKNALVELEEAKFKADQANEAKSAFLANMSHEIRTPLNGIIGLTDIILNTELREFQRDYLIKVKQSSKALLHIINDILDYSKIEAGKLDIVNSEFYLESLLHNLSDLFGHQISQKGLEFIFTVEPECPVHLIGDSLRLNQILINLVGNAVKFTDKGSVQLDIRPTEQDEHQVTIQFNVKDSGIGISAAKQKQLFKAFEQGDNTTTKKYGGSGLGLMISKQLVELMGGTISVESKEGFGTIFSFSVTFEYIEHSMECDLGELQKHKFLIVDDCNVDRTYLQEVLTSWDINVDTANDGQDALNKLKKMDFDTLITDWKMPKMDGIQLLEELKDDNIHLNNILMVTSYDKQTLQDDIRFRNLQVNDLLTKPYTPSMLFDVLIGKKTSLPDDSIHADSKWVLASPKKLLLVEDNETNQLVASTLFHDMGFDVDIANNGLEAVNQTQKQHYDIIFMDLQMPVMDGFEASKRIRLFNSVVPIVALSAAVMQKDQSLTLEAGMQHHIAKPIDKKEILSTIEQYFELNCIEHQCQQVKACYDKYIPNGITAFDMHNVFRLYEHMQPERVYALYATFKNSFEGVPEQLEDIDPTSDDFFKLIHKLKGASANMQMQDIAEQCQSIEVDGATDILIKTLQRRLEDIIDDINTYIVPLLSYQEQSDISQQDAQALVEKVINDIDSGVLVTQQDFDHFLRAISMRIDDSLLQQLNQSFINNDEKSILMALHTVLKELG